MEGSNCGGEGGWTRVAYINMTKLGSTCPEGLELKTISGLTLCGNIASYGCDSTIFPALSKNYQKVCGQLRGYQFGITEAFDPYTYAQDKILDELYLDGASITYGSPPRTHIWSYAAGLSDQGSNTRRCPCNYHSSAGSPPFVGNDYYCETGGGDLSELNVLYDNDPLWDGELCTNLESTCCTNPDMPWFTKSFNTTINEDIELRLCHAGTYREILLEIIELFVL